MPAVLDRPHTRGGEPMRPAQRLEMSRLASSDRALAQNLARPRVHRHQRVVALVRIRPDHDHLHRPFVWMSTDEADLRRTNLTGGDATLLSSHAGDPRAVAGDTTDAGQA